MSGRRASGGPASGRAGARPHVAVEEAAVAGRRGHRVHDHHRLEARFFGDQLVVHVGGRAEDGVLRPQPPGARPRAPQACRVVRGRGRGGGRTSGARKSEVGWARERGGEGGRWGCGRCGGRCDLSAARRALEALELHAAAQLHVVGADDVAVGDGDVVGEGYLFAPPGIIRSVVLVVVLVAC